MRASLGPGRRHSATVSAPDYIVSQVGGLVERGESMEGTRTIRTRACAAATVCGLATLTRQPPLAELLDPAASS